MAEATLPQLARLRLRPRRQKADATFVLLTSNARHNTTSSSWISLMLTIQVCCPRFNNLLIGYSCLGRTFAFLHTPCMSLQLLSPFQLVCPTHGKQHCSHHIYHLSLRMPPKDFEKKAQKVGRKRLAPSSETRIDVKVSKLDIQRPDEDVDETAAAESASTLDDGILQTRHHNTQHRRRALAACVRLVQEQPSLVWWAGSDVLQCFAVRLADSEPTVRSLLVPLLSRLLSYFPPESSLSTASLLVPYLLSALTKLNTSMRLDALAAVHCMVGGQAGTEAVAAALVQTQPALFDAILSLLEPSLYSAGTTVTCLHTTVDRRLGVGVGAGQGAQNEGGKVVQALARAALPSLQCRIAVCACLRALLSLPPAPASSRYSSGALQAGEAYRIAAGTEDGRVEKALHGVAASAGMPLLQAAHCIYQCVHLWLDCGPGEAHAQGQGAQGQGSPQVEVLKECCSSIIHAWGALLREAQRLQKEPIVQGALLLACGGSESDSAALSSLQEACLAGQAGTGGQEGGQGMQMLRLAARCIHVHVLKYMPVRASAVGSTASSLSSLNLLQLTLTTAMLPTRQALDTAQAHVEEMRSRGAVTSTQAPVAPKASNPFAALAPTATSMPGGGGKGGQDAGALGGGRRGKAKDKQAISNDVEGSMAEAGTVSLIDPVQDAYRAAWRVAISSAAKLSKCTAAVADLQGRATGLAQEMLLEACTACEARASPQSSSYMLWEHLSPSLLSSILTLIHSLGCDPTSTLGHALLRAHTTAAVNSRLRAGMVGIMDVLLRVQPTLHPWPGAAAHPSSVLVDPLPWLSALPRYLWARGTQDMDTSGVCMRLLADVARRTPLTSPLGVALREIARGLTPLLYTVRTGKEGEESSGECVYGPWKDYRQDVQEQTCAFLHATQAVAHFPLLRRAAAVLMRCESVSTHVRSMLASSVVEALLSFARVHAQEGQEKAVAAFPACAWLLSVCLGRAVEASAVGFAVSPPSSADAGYPLLPQDKAGPCPTLQAGSADGQGYVQVLGAVAAALALTQHAAELSPLLVRTVLEACSLPLHDDAVAGIEDSVPLPAPAQHLLAMLLQAVGQAGENAYSARDWVFLCRVSSLVLLGQCVRQGSDGAGAAVPPFPITGQGCELGTQAVQGMLAAVQRGLAKGGQDDRALQMCRATLHLLKSCRPSLSSPACVQGLLTTLEAPCAHWEGARQVTALQLRDTVREALADLH